MLEQSFTSDSMNTLKDEYNLEVFSLKQNNTMNTLHLLSFHSQSTDISSIAKIPFENVLETACEWAFYQVFKRNK